MSSFFDEAARRYHQDEAPLTWEQKVALVTYVRDRYKAYLAYLVAQALKIDRGHAEDLQGAFERHFGGALVEPLQFIPGGYKLDRLLEDMHTFAHQVGAQHLALRGKRHATDNPYAMGGQIIWPGTTEPWR